MAGGSDCPCEEASGWSLAKCIAPPPGEYEVHLKTPSGATLVVNEEGFFLRRFSVEETLPFMTTHDRPVTPSSLDSLASLDEVLCETAKALREAASHGSLKAKRKIKSCRRIIEEIERGCR